jgi:hypothetical protein
MDFGTADRLTFAPVAVILELSWMPSFGKSLAMNGNLFSEGVLMANRLQVTDTAKASFNAYTH